MTPSAGAASPVSAIARSRRDQIVAATVAVIAAEGYRAATYSRIAAHAELSSTRLISYHFASKDELVAAVLATVGARIDGEITVALAAVEGQDAGARLAAYIRAVARLHVTHRAPMAALAGIVLDHRTAAGERPWDHDDDRAALRRVEDILRAGQESGTFRAFDPFVVASAVQRSLDGLAFLLGTAPELDLEHYADELVAVFDRATRA